MTAIQGRPDQSRSMHKLRLDDPLLDSQKWQYESLASARMRAEVLFFEARPFLTKDTAGLLDEADLRAWSSFSGQIRLSVRWRGLKTSLRLARYESVGGFYLAHVFEHLALELRKTHLEG